MTVKVLLSIAFILFSLDLSAQLFSGKVNGYDENGKRTGKWITFWDDENKVPMSMGKFKEGRETGVCKEYHIN